MKHRILLFGSSIIHRWHSFSSYFSNHIVYRFGISGLKVSSIFQYVNNLLSFIRKNKIDLFFFYAGANDLKEHQSKEYIIYAIYTFLHKIQTQFPRVTIYILSILKSPKMRACHKIKEIDFIHRFLQKYFHYINLNKIINSYNNYQDDLHITEKAYDQCNQYIATFIEPIDNK